MRGKDSNGHEYIFMPREPDKAINKLADLGVLAAAREWERAALVALLVKNNGRGRPRSGVARGFNKYTISEFTRIGIYGFKTDIIVAAYLRIWEMTGLPVPEPGERVTLPIQDFPDLNEILGRKPGEDLDLDEEVEDESEDEEEEAPSPTPRSRSARPSPSPSPSPSPAPPAPPRPPARGAIDNLLAAFNRISPNEIVQGASVEQVRVFAKTLESWLEDLQEALREMESVVPAPKRGRRG